MGLKTTEGLNIKITDFSVNNSDKVTTFTMAPSNVDQALREGINVRENTLTITAPTSMIGDSIGGAYKFVKGLTFYKGSSDT